MHKQINGIPVCDYRILVVELWRAYSRNSEDEHPRNSKKFVVAFSPNVDNVDNPEWPEEVERAAASLLFDDGVIYGVREKTEEVSFVNLDTEHRKLVEEALTTGEVVHAPGEDTSFLGVTA